VHADTADFVLVFLPTTPNPTSGYLLLVPREQVIEVAMTVEEGVRMVISGGILRPEMVGRPGGSAARPVRDRVRESLGPQDLR
jgi:uncharacterized membrane protein